MSIISTQTNPAAVSIETGLEAPIPYAAQALIRIVNEALDMPEPAFEADDEGLYLTTVARRLDAVRELLDSVITAPSTQNTARAADEMGRWLTGQSLRYRPLAYEGTDAAKELDPLAQA